MKPTAALLFLAACASGPAPLPVRFEPTGDVVYKIDDDLGHESWDFALVTPDGIDRLRVEHLAAGTRVHTVELAGPALAAYRQEGAFRYLDFRLPAVAAADTVEVTLFAGNAVRARGRARLARFEQRQDFRLPVSGCWFVSSGHDFGVEHRRHYSRGHFAWDLVRVDAQGRPSTGPRAEDHLAFGAPVLAPGDGVVVEARGDLDDRPPGSPGKRDDANIIVIEHGDGVRSRLMHLRKGSVRVAAGDRVTVGQVIAAAGNSGASDAPHLHLHFERAGLPLPVQLGHYRVTWNQGTDLPVDRGRPRRGQFVCAD